MRITDTSCLVTARNGLVHFECDGTSAALEPDVAARAGKSLIARAKAVRHGKRVGTLERRVRTGEQLIASAAEAIRQRGIAAVTLPQAA